MQQKTERKLVWTNTAVVCLVALLCCFLWGSAFPGIKIGYGIFDISGEQTGLQIIFAGTRFFLAGIMAVVIGSFAHKRPLFPKKTSWLPILHLSLLQTTLQYFFFYIGLGKTSGVKASIIEALNVILEKMGRSVHELVYDFVEQREKKVNIDNIVYIENFLHRACFHLVENDSEKEYTVYKKLNDIEQEIKEEKFVRIQDVLSFGKKKKLFITMNY